jgi:branched-chain amino acid transport system ATP-binding protein
MSELLAFKNVHAFYGKSHVLFGVDMVVNEGEIVSLLGRNGTGRSTALKAAMGLVAATGSIEFRRETITGLRAFEIARKGIGYVPEGRDVFPALTVEQNLILGEKKRSGGVSSKVPWSLDDMYSFFPHLKERRQTPAGVLSGGEQQMLTLCRTLMGNPDMILIDEPTEGLAPRIVDLVGEYLIELRNRRISVLLVEQKLSIAMKVSQRVYVMGHGSIVFEGTPSELLANAKLCRQWLEV